MTAADTLRRLADVLEALERADVPAPRDAADAPVTLAPASWRERLWTAPPETRLGVGEVAEALGWTVSRVYRHCSAAAAKGGLAVKRKRPPIPLLPHRKLGADTVFVIGELRAWIEANEQGGHPGSTRHKASMRVVR